jgi:hypothetical protein
MYRPDKARNLTTNINIHVVYHWHHRLKPQEKIIHTEPRRQHPVSLLLVNLTADQKNIWGKYPHHLGCLDFSKPPHEPISRITPLYWYFQFAISWLHLSPPTHSGPAQMFQMACFQTACSRSRTVTCFRRVASTVFEGNVTVMSIGQKIRLPDV